MTSTNLRALFSWCSYEWAIQGFPTVITTSVFAAYFASSVAADKITGTSQWSYTLGASALAAALLSPLLGAIADCSGRRKPWVFAFTMASVLATGALWFVRPDPAYALVALVLIGVSNLSLNIGVVFYNAMLPDVAPKNMIGRFSGWGWSFGLIGGVALPAIPILFLVLPDTAPFGLDKGAAEPIRAMAIFAALWIAVFSIPFFLLAPDAPSRGLSAATAVRKGIASLINTFVHIRKYRQIVLFLLARMTYTDGLTALYAFLGIFAVGAFGLDTTDVVLLGTAMGITACVGAFAFGWIDDWIGPKRTILIGVASIAILEIYLLLVETRTWFWVFLLPIGVFSGPVQASSRSLMARLAPPEVRTEMFAFYAWSGKITAFAGPALIGWVTFVAGSQRAGMATLLAFFIVGIALLLPVRDVQ